MPNLIGYTSNVAKSVVYATANYVSENMSTVKDVKETNSELFKATYSNIINYRQTYKRILNTTKNSQVYVAGEQLMKSLKEDLKNGTFYNSKRVDQISSEQAMGGLDDFGDLDNFNFDDDDFSMDEPKSSNSRSNNLVSSTISASSEENASAVSNSIIRSSEYTAQVSRENTNLLYIQNNQMYNGMTKHFGVINQNIGSLLPVLDITKRMMENQSKYFEESTKLLQDQTSLLREISINMKTMIMPEKKQEKRKSTYNDVVMGGVPDLKAYGSRVKDNIMNNPDLGLITSTLNSMGDDTNILKMLAANPLGMIMEGLVGKFLIGKNLKKSMSKIDKTAGTLFASLTAKLNGFTDEDRTDNPFRDKLNGLLKVFSVDTGTKRSISPDKYHKGEMKWNGYAQKALTDVIPQQLSKIISILSGIPGQIFDYEKGIFKDHTQIKKDFKSVKDNYQEGATREIESEMKNMSKYINMSYNEQESLFKDMKSMLKTIYDKGSLFEYNNKNLDHTYYNIQDSDNYELLKALFKNTNKDTQKQLSQNIMNNRASQKLQLVDEENKGHSIYNSLENNLFNEKDFPLDAKGNVKKNSSLSFKNSPLNIKGEKGHNGFWYLDQMLRELKYIRTNMNIGGTGVSGGGRRGRGNNSNSNRPNIDDYNIPYQYETNREEARELSNRQRNEDNFETNKEKVSRKYKLFDPTKYESEDLSKRLDARLYNVKEQKEYEKKSLGQNKDSFFKDIMNTLDEEGTSYDRIKSITGKINSIIQKPNELLTKVLDKVDDRLYNLIYGNGDKVDDRGFMTKMIEKMKNTFDNFSIWLDEKVIDPLSDKIKDWGIKDKIDEILDRTGLKDLGKSFKTYLFGDKESGVDGLFSDIGRGVKSTFSNAWGTTKNAFSNVFSPITNKIKGRFSGLNRNEDRAAENFSQNIGGVVNQYISDNVPHMAGGGNVKKTGMTVLSEGEQVIPKEEVKMYENFKKFIKSSANDLNTDKSSNESIANKMHLKFKNALRGKEKGSEEYNGVMSNLLGMMNHDKVKSLFDSDDKNKQYAGILNSVLKEINSPTKTKNGVTNFIVNMGDELKGATSKLYSGFIHGENQTSEAQMKKDKEKVGNYIADASKTISTYAPEAVGSALLGSGVSLLTGMIGGPLLGAAVGAGISITKHSEKMQNMLFGEEVEDENGNKQRKGGFFAKATSQKFMDKLKKFGPTLKDYGIVGGVAGLTPFLPFGPITGIMLGSAFSYAKETGKVNKWLFGEDNEKWMGKNKEKFKSMLPKIGAGALVAATVGPFGLLGNVAVGGAVGFATTTERFQNAIFGRPDSNGKYIGGLLPHFKEKIIDPMGDFFKIKSKHAIEWFKKKVFTPIESSMKPFGKQLTVMASGLGKGILKIFDKVVESSLGVPFTKLIAQIGTPIGKAVTKIAGGIIKGTIGIPAGLIGKAGNGLRKHQIKVGTADYMSASERLDFRRKHMMGVGDKFSEFDQLLEQGGQGDINNLNKIRDSFSGIKSDHKKNKSDQTMKLEEMGGLVSKDLGYFTSKRIQKLIKDGKTKEALNIINSTGQLNDGNRDILKSRMTQKLSEYDTIKTQGVGNSTNYRNLAEKLKASGVKIPESIIRDPSKLSKYIDLVDKEINITKKKNDMKSPEEKMEELQKKEAERTSTFREKINKGIEQITTLLHDIAHPAPDVNKAMGAFGNVNNKNSIEKSEDGRLFYKNTRGEKIYVDNNGIPLKNQSDDIDDNSEELLTASDVSDNAGIINGRKRRGKKSERKKNTRDDTGKEYHIDGNNNIIYDKGDSETQEVLKKEKEDESFKTKFMDYVKSSSSKIKDVTNSVSSKVSDGKDAINGAKNMMTKMLGVGVALGFAPQIFNFIKSTVYPWFRDKAVPFLIGTVAPAIGSAIGSMIVPALKGLGGLAVDGVKGVAKWGYNNTLGKVFGKVDKEDKTISKQYTNDDGNNVTTYSDGSVDITDQSGKIVSSSPATTDSANPMNNVPGAALRYAVTGGRTGTKSLKAIGFLAKHGGSAIGRGVNAAMSIFHPIKTLLHPIKAITGRNETLLGKVFSKSGKLINGSTSILTKAGALVNKVYSGIDKKILESSIGKTFTSAVTSSNIVSNTVSSKLSESVQNFIMKLLNNDTVQKLIGSDTCEKIVKNGLPHFAEKLSEGLAKNAAKISGKMLALATTGGLLNIAFAIGDFISGYRNAQATLGITDEPTFSQKVVCGLLKAITGFSIVLSVLPDDFWTNLLYDTILPALGDSDKELQDQRDKARQQLDDYNKKNNTSLSIDQFINKKNDSKPEALKKDLSLKSFGQAIHVVSQDPITADEKAEKDERKKSRDNFGSMNDAITSGLNYVGNGAKYYAGKAISGISSLFGGEGGPNISQDKNYYNEITKKYSGVGGPSSANGINTVLRGKLANMGQTYIDLGNKYGVDPSLAASIMMNETGGDSNALDNDNNPAGIMDWNNNWKTVKHFDTLNDGLDYAVKNLYDTYISKGLTTIDQIGSKYAPIGAANDPQGLNKDWVPNVTSFYKKATGDDTINNPNATGNSTNSDSSSQQQPGGIANFFTSLGTSFSNSISSMWGNNKNNNSSSNISSNTNATGSAAQVINSAKQFLGSPYVWGGTTAPNKDSSGNWIGGGFDCSGFVQYVYKQAGIDLSRTTYTQIKEGTAVNNISDLQPGDLVFFGEASAPHHVGIYLGNDQYIHAPKTGDVIKISNLSDRTDFCGGRRILGSVAQGGPVFNFKGIGGKKFKSSFNGVGGIGDILANSLGGNVTSGFGYRNTTGNIPKNHTGIDIGASKGTKIKSPVGGTVISNKSTNQSDGFGNLLVVKDGVGGEHYFGHMNSTSALKPGDTVNPGDSIGNVGSTGNSTGPHLHYETRANGVPVNPDEYIRKTFEIQQNNGIGGADDYSIDNSNTSNSSDYSKFFQSVVNLLAKICNNTDQLTKIADLLSGTNTDSKSTDTSSTPDNNKQQLLNKIQKATQSNQDLSLSDLMNQMELLAKGI